MSRFNQLPRFKRVILLGSTVFVISVCLFLLAEVTLRARHWVKYGGLWGIEETYAVDETTGLRIPKPGSAFGPIEINSLGFRGPELATPKPPSTLRIAFLGASTTYCAEVSNNEATWSHIVSERLQQHYPEVRIDYVNAGVPGYGVSHSGKNLELRVAPLRPDIIIIYHATNDLSHNSFRLAAEEGLVQNRTERELAWPARYSLLWYLAEKNLRVLKQQGGADRLEGKLDAEPDALAAPFKADLEQLVRESKEDAALVALVTFSSRIRRSQNREEQRAAAVTSLYYMPYMSLDGLLDGFDAYNAAIRAVAQEQSVLLVGNEDTIPADAAHYVDSVHFTDLGSRAMADRVATALMASKEFRSLVTRPGGH